MKRTLQGWYVTVSTAGESVQAFVPAPLPPVPPIDWTPSLREAFDRAHSALGRLDGVATMLPDPSLLLYSFVRKEAVLSSMIEGTQSSLADLLLYEIDAQPGVPIDDAREVSSCVAAILHGASRLRSGFPLSLRLIREVHGVLLAHGRGQHLAPGEFRRSQNWIGGTRPGTAVFVPPPPGEIDEALGSLELFLHDQPASTPALLKAALSHVQFETIHPFLDGNGRVGRLLITLLLCDAGVLREPLLYLSLFFKTHRQTYYDLLDRVRRDGDWEAWLEFFAEAVAVSTADATESARQIVGLVSADRERIAQVGRQASSMLEVHYALQRQPIATAGWLVGKTGITAATVNKCLAHLEQMGILREITGRRRGRVFSYGGYVKILTHGMELPGGGRVRQRELRLCVCTLRLCEKLF